MHVAVMKTWEDHEYLNEAEIISKNLTLKIFLLDLDHPEDHFFHLINLFASNL